MTALAARARAMFPRGLLQPEGSFRFSADALLLAAFAVRYCLPEKEGARLLDLGCGCGVVGFACLLAHGDAHAQGVDLVPELAAAAVKNADTLGLAARYAVSQDDLEAESAPGPAWAAPADVVLANMPYRREGAGRPPRSPLRRKALFAGEGTVAAFMRAAARAVAAGGSFALIFPWDARRFFIRALRGHGFAVHTLLPVRTGGRGKARCLVRAVRSPLAGRARCKAPLIIHGPNGYTAEALAFCPWLDTKHRVPGPAGRKFVTIRRTHGGSKY